MNFSRRRFESPSRDDLHADIERYRADPWVHGRFWWMTERTLWAVVVFRVGNILLETASAATRRPILSFYTLIVIPIAEAVTGIELPLSVKAGPGLRIYHGIGLVISGGSVLGARCTLRQGACVGTLDNESGSPTLGDDVSVGVHAQVLGSIMIGSGAKIGAGAVVLSDVPAGATAVGVPARIIPGK